MELHSNVAAGFDLARVSVVLHFIGRDGQSCFCFYQRLNDLIGDQIETDFQ